MIKCFKCKVLKPASKFKRQFKGGYDDRSSSFTLSSVCKQCTNDEKLEAKNPKVVNFELCKQLAKIKLSGITPKFYYKYGGKLSEGARLTLITTEEYQTPRFGTADSAFSSYPAYTERQVIDEILPIIIKLIK